jgi:fumarate reductase (CoM/CoB) subunit A
MDPIMLSKDESALERTLDELDRIAGEDLTRLTIAHPVARAAAMGTISLHQVAMLVAKSALLRRESRGPHFRTDYPQEGGDQFRRWLVWRSRNGQTPRSAWETPGVIVRNPADTLLRS